MGEHLGDNVDFNVKLDTGSGWVESDVTKVHIYRQKTVTDNGSTSRANLIDIEGSPYYEFDVGNFSSYIFEIKGEHLIANAVPDTGGTNKLILVPIKSDGNVYNNHTVDTDGIAATDINITEADLNYTLESVSSTTFTWNVVIPTNGFSAGTAISSKTKYKIPLLTGENLVSLEPGTSSDTWKFKVHSSDDDGDYYIGAQVPPSPSGTSQVPVYQFFLNKVTNSDDDNRYRILGGTKLLTWTGNKPTGKNGLFQLIDQNNLTKEQHKNSIVEIVPSTAPRVYPPKPYPRTTPDNQVKNTFSWRVDGADYGNGMYKVDMNGSMAADASWHGVLDAEGLFDKGIDSKPLYEWGSDDHAYHSLSNSEGNAVSWFHFHLPVYINLDNIKIVTRGHGDTDEEITNMAPKWEVYAQERSDNGTIVGQTRLFSNVNVTFTKGEIKTLDMDQVDKKFNEFKVIMTTNKPNKYTVINEILFYGSNESATP